MLTCTLTFLVTMTTGVVAMEIPITKRFTGGFQCQFCYTLPQPVSGWTGRIVMDQPVASMEIYRANLIQTLRGGKEFLITNKTYNGKLEEGEDLCLKFTARTRDGVVPNVVQFYLHGADSPAGIHGNPDHTLPEDILTTPGFQQRSSTVLWELRNMPSSEHDPFHPFHPQSGGKFDEGSLSIVNDPAGRSGKVLRVFYQKGHYGGIKSHRGAQFYSRPISARLSLTLSYDLYFSHGFDFVKGGKLPGLFGGATNCSGGRHSDLCFSTRLMWRSHGDGEVYAYLPEHQDSSLCHHSGNHCNPDYGNSLGRGSWRFKTGQWQTITQQLTLNTPGHLNGKIKIWYDGHLALQMDNLNIRNRKELKIEGLFFSTFFGGSDHTWAPTADCYTYFKNFVMSAGEDENSVIG